MAEGGATSCAPPTSLWGVVEGGKAFTPASTISSIYTRTGPATEGGGAQPTPTQPAPTPTTTPVPPAASGPRIQTGAVAEPEADWALLAGGVALMVAGTGIGVAARRMD